MEVTPHGTRAESALERIANWMMDMDWGWWPFLHLRPPKDRRIDAARTVKITLHFSPHMWCMLALFDYVINHRVTVLRLVVLGGVAMALFFIGFGALFVIFWNRRADRLASEAQRSS